MERRPYGQTGEDLSIIGLGGILLAGTTPDEADRYVAETIDRGVNYFDVAPTYGNAEERLGPALEPYRDRVFLACKTTQRKREEAWAELQSSLKRLRTDHVDLYQLHGMNTAEDVQQATASDGVLGTCVKAREQGLARFIGFSAHSEEVALTLMDRFEFDSVLFPVNWVNYLQANFGPRVIAHAQEKGIARLALKAMARTRWENGQRRHHLKCWYEPVTDPEEADLAIRFALSQPITAAVPPGEIDLLRLALDIADRFVPMTEEEISALKHRTADLEPIFR